MTRRATWRRRISRMLLQCLPRLMPAGKVDWATAMTRECDHIADDTAALAWTCGCVLTATKLRTIAMVDSFTNSPHKNAITSIGVLVVTALAVTMMVVAPRTLTPAGGGMAEGGHVAFWLMYFWPVIMLVSYTATTRRGFALPAGFLLLSLICLYVMQIGTALAVAPAMGMLFHAFGANAQAWDTTLKLALLVPPLLTVLQWFALNRLDRTLTVRSMRKNSFAA